MRNIEQIEAELKEVINQAKEFPEGSYKHVVLKHKATKLHLKLIEIETFIKNSKGKFAA